MNKLKLSVAALLASLSIGLVTVPAYAACGTPAECVKAGVASSGSTGAKSDLGGLIKTVVNVMLFILGAIAVIMIILGGIKYTVSNGDGAAVTSAKNTILYAVVGLIVALMAYAIVSFVIDRFV